MDPTRIERGHPFAGGIIGGLIGGLALAVLLVVTTVASGGDPWVPLKGAALPFLGARAQAAGFDPGAIALALVSHAGISIAWGLLFAVIGYGLSRGATLLAGVLWGVVVWFGMYYLVLPVAGLPELARSTPLLHALVAHVVFGLALAIGFLPFQHEYPAAPTVTRGHMAAS